MVILKQFEEKSLKEVLEYGTELNLNDRLTMIKDIANIVKALHKTGIAHRNLSIDSIRMKRYGPAIKLIIGGFDIAIKLPPGK